ncbi:hypothetical protein KZO01_15850 [Kurthia zopfii]|uniref:DNA-binding protein (MmcQ/YjbR family) n=1 Tax=Kurthia zopfii TaxID=1650 RepID=A0A2U3ADK9_9BACL|nr:MmcQ/YjbR family DNA-binding protein [Kurthia zopfii]PWI22595.1 DNA-binding protein [Kurthia zopfii]TDR39053.1 putative DNA-binding protein (MmcQ/YjbR family) [Kurthia zopfii]STX09589.1 Uncharacterized protein conserved in bacteria [Kurthia zopfii]VEI06798.1 Uncharacterized protein conserved in bacteria [Kurthia zopfii]GEK31276.1 hypothetical protein KZO01_15850 [Kurthia zopfii]
MEKEVLEGFCKSLKGVTTDFQQEWGAQRYHIGGKMFAMFGTDAKGVPIFTLKCDPAKAEELREQYEEIVPGYYMNKTHWISIYYSIDESNEFAENLLAQARQLVFNKLTKKVQKEIG